MLTANLFYLAGSVAFIRIGFLRADPATMFGASCFAIGTLINICVAH